MAQQPQSLIARPYQARTIEATRASFRSGKRAIVIVLPTGGGKTFLATQLSLPVLQKGKRVFFIVHREELADQARAAFERLGFKAGVIASGQPASKRPFQIVSLQTAVARGLLLQPDLALADECHHLSADRWSEPIRAMRAAGVPIIGLTATPDRGDGRGLAPLFDDLIVGAQPSELIASGHLVPCRVVSPAGPRKSLAEHPVRAYHRFAKGRRTAVFCGTVDHARRLAEEFSLAGVRAACVDGEMADIDRATAIDDFREGRLDVLTSVQILTEGFDVPETSAIITTTGASHPAPLIQKVGRGMRPSPGKNDCIHIDLRGAWIDLAMLPGEDRIFSLDGKAITTASREYGVAVVRCRQCGCLFLANEFKHSTCPECGALRRGKEDPRVRRARMAVISNRMPDEERVHWLARKIIEGRSRRKKDGGRLKAVGWAIANFGGKFREPNGKPGRPTEAMVQEAIKMANRGET